MNDKNLVPSGSDSEELLVDLAYAKIHGAIVRNELKPGVRLSEATLSNQLGISRTPIREALKRLQEERLIKVLPRRGAFVTDISAEDIVAIYQLREALECFAIQFVPQYGDRAELEALAADIEQSSQWLKNGDVDRVNDLDVRLHKFIAGGSRNPMICKLIDQLLHQVIRLRGMTPSVPGRLERQMQEHREIILALRSGDIDRAREAVRIHLQTVRDTAVQIRLRM